MMLSLLKFGVCGKIAEWRLQVVITGLEVSDLKTGAMLDATQEENLEGRLSEFKSDKAN